LLGSGKTKSILQYGIGSPKILFQQKGRQGQDLTNGIEAMTCIVGRKEGLGVKINTEKIPDRVSVLHPVKAPQDNPTGIPVSGIVVENGFLHPGQNPVDFLIRGLRLVGGWHVSAMKVFPSSFPGISLLQKSIQILCAIQRNPSLFGSFPMAIVAILGQERLDFIAVFSPKPVGSGPEATGNEQSQGQSL
tara:strand:- start:305 stop:874 length:570 start_codon:yes stop_codon:yes gene_type:complete